MPFVPGSGVVEVEIRMIEDLQQVENTLYFHTGAAINPTGLTNLVNAVEAWWVDNLAPLTSATVRLNEIAATDLTTASSTAIVLPALPGSVGGHAINAMPNNCSLCVSFRTSLRGRSFRGRNYFVGLCEDQVTNNTVEFGTVGGIQDAYAAMVGDGALADGWEWGVFSRYSGMSGTPPKPTPRAAGVFTPITSVQIVDPVIDSMRRRLPGRGR